MKRIMGEVRNELRRWISALCTRGPQPSPSGCIRNGYAYAPGASIPIGRSCLYAKCEDHAWRTVGQECFSDLGIVKFQKNGVVIDEKVGVAPTALASRLKTSGGGRFEIQGHADATEKDPVPLSKRRARAVRDRLIHLGIAPDSLSIRGLGAAAPRLEPTRRYLDAFNARVELVPVR
jgi:outer membrane protein OmpA-like peptidoglycan-associated protein